MPYNKLNIGGTSNKGADVLSWVTHELGFDETAMLRNVSRLPCLYKHVALMPDAHLGKGSMVGSVIATKDAVIPATVGVDIGCGMMAVKTPFRSGILDRKLAEFRHEIERAIPVGFNDYKEAVDESNEWEGWSEFDQLHKGVQDRKRKAMKQLGTLGGGNHFIEVCLDTDDYVWLMLHSGSRNIGNEVATRHIATAKSLHDLNTLPAADLAYFVFGTPEFKAYWHDLDWSQRYAMLNREIMMKRLLRSFKRMFNDQEEFDPEITVNCHHNYVAIEEHFGDKVYVTRKGAINAEEGRYGIIPGSMGAKSFIIKGLGNPDSFNSCSHGAGRKMSRTRAKAKYTIDDLKKQTEGVECRKDKGVVDEIPGAYKDIEEVMRAQDDLVEIVAELKQVICVKG
ncbi:MAG TPA: RtcB family protein [Pyrinomonadaceae bacterium]|nr:RtcB family protein [Pyrinomonadaceae bacterium]